MELSNLITLQNQTLQEENQQLKKQISKLKAMYKNNDSCLSKAADNEMLFVLRTQDVTAPKIVLTWMAENFNNTSEDKLREAFEAALEMKRWHNRRLPD